MLCWPLPLWMLARTPRLEPTPAFRTARPQKNIEIPKETWNTAILVRRFKVCVLLCVQRNNTGRKAVCEVCLSAYRIVRTFVR